jgi:hypothetical protein
MDHRYISFGARTKKLPSRSKLDPAPRKSLDSRGQRAEARVLRKVISVTKGAAKSISRASASAKRPKSKGVKKPAAKKSAAKKPAAKKSAAPKNLAQKRTTARMTAPRKSKSPRRSSSNELLCRPSYDWGPGNTHSNVSESRRRRCMRLRNSEEVSLNDAARCRENPKYDDSCVVRGKRYYPTNDRTDRAEKAYLAARGTTSNGKKKAKKQKARK